jgi:hypothetical protein
MTADAREFEAQRIEALKEIAGSRSSEFAPGTLGCHEALHASWMMMDAFDRQVRSHAAIVLDPEFFQLASEAHERLFALYQAIGAKHLGGSD